MEIKEENEFSVRLAVASVLASVFMIGMIAGLIIGKQIYAG